MSDFTTEAKLNLWNFQESAVPLIHYVDLLIEQLLEVLLLQNYDLANHYSKWISSFGSSLLCVMILFFVCKIVSSVGRPISLTISWRPCTMNSAPVSPTHCACDTCCRPLILNAKDGAKWLSNSA